MTVSAVAPPRLATSSGWVASIMVVIAPSQRWISAVAAARAQIARGGGPRAPGAARWWRGG